MSEVNIEMMIEDSPIASCKAESLEDFAFAVEFYRNVACEISVICRDMNVEISIDGNVMFRCMNGEEEKLKDM